MLVFISLICYQANAQTFGIKLGLNFATMSQKDNNKTYSDNYNINPGFHIGAIVDYPFDDLFSLESGLLFTTKGMEYNEVIERSAILVKTNLYYLDVPITLKGTKKLGVGVKLFGTAGPYVGYGLGGNLDYSGLGAANNGTISWGNNASDDFRRLDWGLTFGLGLDVKSVIFGLSYDIGLANIAADQSNGMTTENRVLKFSIGYLFGE